MYARVTKFEGGSADGIRQSAERIKGDAGSGPPPGVPAKGFLYLTDADGGRTMAIALFETEEDLRQGDATLNAMTPPEDSGDRAFAEAYEVVVDIRL